jgi:SAM-dependent methyltransferase
MAMTDQADYPDDLASMVAWVDAIATTGQRVLDVGCGDASLVAALAGRYDVVGADPAATPAPNVRAVRFEELDIAPVDVIVASLSLHHLDELAASAAALRRLAHPGTQILVREFDRERMDHQPALRWWFHQRQARDVLVADMSDHPLPDSFDEFVEQWRGMMHHHVRPWREVCELLGEAGFTMVDEQWGPHWFRWGLGDMLRPAELQLIGDGLMPAVGVRWHGRRAS